MRFLVLGGCGFVGSHVVDALTAEGHSVRVVARRPEAHRDAVRGVDYALGDYRDADHLRAALADCDAVIHAISVTTPGTGDADPRFDVDGNLLATLGLLQVMVETGVKRLIYLSSGGCVYGPPLQLPIPESHPLRPINSYGIVKVAIESYVELYARTKGLSAVILRPSNTYGPRNGRHGSQGLVDTLLYRALNDQPVTIWGDGSIVRDYLHVEDLARLICLAGGSHLTGVFNVGSGVGTSVRELIDQVAQTTGRKIRVEYGQQRSVDVPVSILDISQALGVFGWVPETSLRDGLARTWAWHRSAHPKD